jgi:orotate phosphoribosyltransferase
MKRRYTPTIIAADHLEDILDGKSLRLRVKWTVAKLKHHKFDAIAFRGLSGALVAPAVAMRMNKSLIAVRKAKTDHSPNMVEGDVTARRYVIVDDFVCSGTTIEHIVREIRKVNKNAECIGMCAFAGADPSKTNYTTELRKVKVTIKVTVNDNPDPSVCKLNVNAPPPPYNFFHD